MSIHEEAIIDDVRIPISRIREASMPLVLMASAIAFQEIAVSPAEDQRSGRSTAPWRRAGSGSSGHCGI